LKQSPQTKVNTMKASALLQLLKNNRWRPVLFVSDPVEGDSFAFGTLEELSNEYDSYVENDQEGAEFATAGYFADTIDFEVYGDQDITVRK